MTEEIAVTALADEVLPTTTNIDDDAATSDDRAGKKARRSKDAALSRSVETMFGVTYQNHIGLSQLADGKANTLMAINGAVITLLVGLLTMQGGPAAWTVAPAIVLLVGCTISLVFTVLASRPRIDRALVTVDDIRANRGNVLFFGHFMHMPLTEFQTALHALTADHRLLHDNLARQLYAMGASLAKKYLHLQIAYWTFLAGMALASLWLAGSLAIGWPR